MRGTVFLILCMAVIWGLTSCELEQIVVENNDKTIRFASTSEKMLTRGTPVDLGTDIPDMGVFAFYTGNGLSNDWVAQGSAAVPGFMNNVEVTNNSGVWSYSNPVYWPVAADANISFFAYSPFATGEYNATTNPTGNGITVNVTTGIPTITYTVPESCAAQPDLMVSALKKDLNKTTGSPVVSFAMNHALTSIGFKATGNGEVITSIKITGIRTSGTLTTATDGTFNWTTSSVGTDVFEAIPNLDTIEINPAEVITSNGYLMMIPQTLTSAARLIITKDDNSIVEFNLDTYLWEAGKKVVYTINLEDFGIYVGMFGGELIEDINGVWQFERPLYVQREDVPANEWANSTAAATIQTGYNDWDGKGLTFAINTTSSTNYPVANYCFKKNTNYNSILTGTEANYKWYLPSKNELWAIWVIHESFKNTEKLGAEHYWSSTTREESNNTNEAWFVDFSSGISGSNGKRINKTFRCVR